MEIELFYKDNDLLVCRKPAGIATQTAKLTQQDLVSLLKNRLAAEGESSELHVVHRLDQPVEGLLVFARNSRTAAFLDRQVSDASGHFMQKEYRAEICGSFAEPSGRLEDLLVRDAKTNTSRVADHGEKGAKRATLRYETLAVYRDTAGQERSMVKVLLETGRHHQIRVQMAHAGHVLVGDTRYGYPMGIRREPLKLCACRLSFRMPDQSMKQFEIEPSWQAQNC